MNQQPPPPPTEAAPEKAQQRSSSVGGSPACAACKYQRRKCAPDCPLAPHFPPSRHKEFHNAHKLFGVSNMLKITRELSPGRRSLAMKTIIHQANVRALDPVGGCYHVILGLQHQIKSMEAELDLVLRQLAYCQAHAAAAFAPNGPDDDEVIGLQSLREEKSCLDRDAYKVLDDLSVKIENHDAESLSCTAAPGHGKAASALLQEHHYLQFKPTYVDSRRV
ncbi:unnamed protein product [Linum tenue]|uniref:LOB domain-containing protein n=1 Tax=Linum tenue TaxID=586396 RepID=A0AAV0MQU4_9ROSI|nr:unnamed protein product [Linum tenue]